MGKTQIKKKPAKSSSKKALRDLNLLESVNIKGMSDLEIASAYMSKAAELENAFKEDKALVFYNKCIELLNPKVNESNQHLEKLIKCLEASSYILIEQDHQEEGKDRLLQVTVLNPDVGYEKYMFLAQLSEGVNAKNLYEKGAQTIQKQMILKKDDQGALDNLKNDLSQTYCAIAEIYMTDLCDEENAEDTCRSNINKALEACPKNPQAFLLSAGLHTVKAQNDEAKIEIQKCLDHWWPKVKKFLEDNKKKDKKEMEVDGENSDEDNEDEGGQIDLEELTGIPFEAHISMAKLLYELEMYQEAADVLEILLEEDDENVEIFYILSKCGDKLNWKDSNPQELRFYATFCKLSSAKLDDKEAVEEMQAIIEKLPEPTGEEEEIQIPDTDEDSDMYEGDEMASGEEGEESWETEDDSKEGESDSNAMNEEDGESDKDSGCDAKKEKS